jgi:hypothetical protein
MLFDPDAGRSTEELILRKWEQEWPEPFKARVLAIADARGCSWWDVVMEAIEDMCEKMEDPAERARVLARYDAEALPFGSDPTQGGGDA